MDLRVNGTTLFYETVGDGAPCLCLHGGPGTDSSGLRRTLAPLADALGLRLVLYDHRGHGRSEWVPVEQCTQDQLVADVEGVRQALGLGRVHVLGISWGGFLGLMYAARYPHALTSLAVVGAAASGEFMARAEANAHAQATPEQWTAYRALWDGSLKDDAAFERAFATIRPLYFFDKSRAAASLRRAPTRATASPCGGSSSRTSTRATIAGASCHASRRPRWWRWGATIGSARWTRPRRSTASCPTRRWPSSRRVATRRRSRRPRPSPGSWRRCTPPRAEGYFPVQRTALSD